MSDDDYPSWDQEEYSGVAKVWHPRVVISNNITDAFHEDWTIVVSY